MSERVRMWIYGGHQPISQSPSERLFLFPVTITFPNELTIIHKRAKFHCSLAMCSNTSRKWGIVITGERIRFYVEVNVFLCARTQPSATQG